MVKAFDRDEPNNARIKYSIIGGNNDYKFEIDGNSGRLKLVQDLDREEKVSIILFMIRYANSDLFFNYRTNIV